MELLPELNNYLSQWVLLAVVLVIFFVYETAEIVNMIEEAIETKKNKQIKIFDHKKIWLNFFWSCIAAVILAVCNYITWKEFPFYLFVIIGGSSFFYEAVLKRLGKD